MPAAIRISDDRMTAWLDLAPGEACPVARLRELIAAAPLRFGLQRETLQEAGRSEPMVRALVVARGEPPQRGNDGTVELLVDVHDRPVSDGTGVVDIHHQHRFADVEAGQPLARALPPTLGRLGRGVDGLEVPAEPGQPADLGAWAGDGVTREGEHLLIAAIPGVCRSSPRPGGCILAVSPTLALRGDVDRTTGDIESRFPIEVGGDIKAGFTVKSGASISVRGVVEDTRVSAMATIQVGGILKGANRVKTRGDLLSRHIEEREVKCRSLAVVNSLIGATVHALGHVAAREIVGGRILCAGSVSCERLGDELGTPTEVHVGINPYEQALYATVCAERDAALFKLQECEERCRNLSAKVNQGAVLRRSDLPHLIAGLKVEVAERERLLAEVARCDQTTAHHRERIEQTRALVEHARVSVTKALMPGVMVRFGDVASFFVREPMPGTVLTCRDGVVAV
jgi:uncharacterized protein (DUF342 family)